MPPVRTTNGRASKACEACRKGKTRCYESGGTSRVCLRCQTLNLECSLSKDYESAASSPPDGPFVAVRDRHSCAALEDRLAQLEQTVRNLTETVNAQAPHLKHAPINAPPVQKRDLAEIGAGDEAPLLVIRDAIPENVSTPGSSTRSTLLNIVDKHLISQQQASYLLELFRNNYERWIAHDGPEDDKVRTLSYSPLLLTACCLIAVRHSTSPYAQQTAEALFDEAKALLSEAILQTPQQLDFYRAVVVLSLWSTTVGQRPLSIDSWLITGIAIQHGSASPLFRGLTVTVGKSLLWTRLCLAHLHSCISMRRSAIIRRADIEPIRNLIRAQELPNYDQRMIAELNLYWIIYENYVPVQVDLPRAQQALLTWKREWSFLLDGPRSQFLLMGFYFAHLLMFEQSLTNKSAAVRESLISEMVRLCTDLISLAMNTADERTKHLTDHIYHMITFSAVTLCRLLSKYEIQLATKRSIPHCDHLILSVIQWLNSLGSTMHVSHTMAQTIDSVFRKLRPNATHLMQRQIDTFPMQLPMEFPEMLGMDALDCNWEAMLPEVQGFVSDIMAQPMLLPR